MKVKTKPCPVCKRTSEIEVGVVDYVSWQNGTLAQQAFPYLTPDERETLISGTHPKCWDSLFSPKNGKL